MSRVSPTYQGGTDGDDFEPTTIEELGNMIGKVAEQIIRENTTVNPLTPFEKGLVENGDTIEQAVVKLVESSAYDPTGAGALTRDETEKCRFRRLWIHAGTASAIQKLASLVGVLESVRSP